jgi:hypothetical protein
MSLLVAVASPSGRGGRRPLAPVNSILTVDVDVVSGGRRHDRDDPR